MMAASTETTVGKSSGTTAQTRISEIISDRITERKLKGNNYLQLKWVIEIYVVGREKTSHLLADPPTPVTDAWTSTMESKIKDLVLHCVL